MNVPHDPVALEEHFKDDDEGPVSNQGYMPYLNRFILDKVVQTSGVLSKRCLKPCFLMTRPPRVSPCGCSGLSLNPSVPLAVPQ